MAAPKEILDLVERFDRNRDAYRSAQYNETQLRREFPQLVYELYGRTRKSGSSKSPVKSSFEQRLDNAFEFGYSMFDNAPNSLRLNTEILVNEHIPKPRDPHPGDFRMLGAKILRKVSRRFADDLKVSDHGILDDTFAGKYFFATCRVRFDLRYRIPDMGEINAIVFHKDTACRITLSFR
jgi:hypothetical protein